MKTNLILSALVISTLFSSCEKEESTPESPATGTPSLTYLISKDSTYDGTASNTQVRIFEYNSSKKLIRVKYKSGTNTSYNSRDTIYYNGSGQVSKVETYNTGNTTAQSTNTYNYTSGVLTSINESGTNGNGAYVRTRTFTYAGGKLSAQTVVYSTGTSDNNGPENITAIAFTGNNITSANATGFGAITLTTETTAANPYYGLNFSSDILNLFNQNNVLKAFLTATPTTILIDNTYTYANGRVATITDAAESPARVTVITYQGL